MRVFYLTSDAIQMSSLLSDLNMIFEKFFKNIALGKK